MPADPFSGVMRAGQPLLSRQQRGAGASWFSGSLLEYFCYTRQAGTAVQHIPHKNLIRKEQLRDRPGQAANRTGCA